MPRSACPAWSPNGTAILISAAVNGQPDLYTIDVASGAMTRFSDDQDDEVAPSWSHDGRAVLFGSRQGGTWQVMQMQLADRTRRQLTVDGGYAAQPSPDGKTILFTRLERPGIWTMAAEAGAATLLVQGVRAAQRRNRRRRGMAGELLVAGIRRGQGRPGIYAHWDRRESNIMALDAAPTR